MNANMKVSEQSRIAASKGNQVLGMIRRNISHKDKSLIVPLYKAIHGWAGHIARFKDNRWTKRVTEWTPREWKRRQGRPKTRWRDSLIHHLGPSWPRIARDRRLWRQFREGFLLTE